MLLSITSGVKFSKNTTPNVKFCKGQHKTIKRTIRLSLQGLNPLGRQKHLIRRQLLLALVQHKTIKCHQTPEIQDWVACHIKCQSTVILKLCCYNYSSDCTRLRIVCLEVMEEYIFFQLYSIWKVDICPTFVPLRPLSLIAHLRCLPILEMTIKLMC